MSSRLAQAAEFVITKPLRRPLVCADIRFDLSKLTVVLCNIYYTCSRIRHARRLIRSVAKTHSRQLIFFVYRHAAQIPPLRIRDRLHHAEVIDLTARIVRIGGAIYWVAVLAFRVCVVFSVFGCSSAS
jgi:hypothetical protein